MIEDECGETCCNHGCNQGRNCPARQACLLPENVPSNFGIAPVWDGSYHLSVGMTAFTWNTCKDRDIAYQAIVDALEGKTK